uniref:Uncharacterized protein n=1 Tax=Rhizophora mucronata TaxID=61149 RepID=A0A2P2PPR8_RHIMU
MLHKKFLNISLKLEAYSMVLLVVFAYINWHLFSLKALY